MANLSLQTIPNSSDDECQRFESLGVSVCIKAGAEQTGGAFNLFDVLCPVGYETPLHIHYAEDVAVYVLEGVLDIFWGEEDRQAKRGSYFFQPRGTPHGFRVNGAKPVRMLYLTFPSGFEDFVMERARPLTDLDAMMLEARHKIEILGSLPALEKGENDE